MSRHALVITAALTLMGGCRSHGSSCRDVAKRTASVWNGERRARMANALGAVPWSVQAQRAVDGDIAAWQHAYKDACTTGASQQCLGHSLARLDALLQQIAPPLDATARARAAFAIAALPPPSSCDPAELVLPDSSADRARVEMFEADYDRAWAAFAIGRTTAAWTIVDSDLLGLSKLHLPRLSAATLSLASAIDLRNGDTASARKHFDEALAAAAETRSPPLAYRVWIEHLRAESNAERVADAPKARAAAKAAGLDGALVDILVGEAQLALGRTISVDVLEHAQTSHDPISALDRAALERSLGEEAIGRDPDAAIALLKAARDRALATLGDGHPELAVYADLLGAAERERGHLRDALAEAERSLLIRTTAFADDEAIATSLIGRARTRLEAGDIMQARADATMARTRLEKKYSDDSPELREVLLLLADIIEAGGTPDEAAAYRQLARTTEGVTLGAPVNSVAVIRALGAAADRTQARALLSEAAKKLPDEPSRTALAIWIELAHTAEGAEAAQAARTAVSLYQAMPQLGRGATYDEMWALSKR